MGKEEEGQLVPHRLPSRHPEKTTWVTFLRRPKPEDLEEMVEEEEEPEVESEE